MANPFERMVCRMDAATLKRMGETAVIDGVTVDVIPAELLMEMGPLSGNGISLVVFSADYRPKRNVNVEYNGKTFTLTRHEVFNRKPRIFIE